MNVRTLTTWMAGSVVAFTGTFGLALAAQADDAGIVAAPKHDDVVVHFADLDLDSADGAKALYTRLSVAAERACGNEPSMHELKAIMHFQDCYDRTLEQAVDDVSNPVVQTLHAEHTDATTSL
jgi:UrcA family protein